MGVCKETLQEVTSCSSKHRPNFVNETYTILEGLFWVLQIVEAGEAQLLYRSGYLVVC